MKHRFAESSQLSRNLHAMRPSLEGLKMCFQDQGLQCGISFSPSFLFTRVTTSLWSSFVLTHLDHPNSRTAFIQIGLIMHPCQFPFLSSCLHPATQKPGCSCCSSNCFPAVPCVALGTPVETSRGLLLLLHLPSISPACPPHKKPCISSLPS